MAFFINFFILIVLIGHININSLAIAISFYAKSESFFERVVF